MRCSVCSEVIKPVVAIDLDGTLGDYHGHFIRFAAEWTGQGIEATLRASLSPYRGNTHFSSYCCVIFDITIEVYRSIKLAYRQAGMKRSMPIFDGAEAICLMVYKEGAELWVTTTRPYLSLDSIVPDTREWLDRHRIGFDHMLFDADKYDVLADRVDSGRVVAVLDDLPEMYDAAAENFGPKVPILIKGNFNKAVTRTNMATLPLAIAIVRERIIEWRKEND
jgi:phosphoglycolate phosphatase-like HAD superfamily hydrolase